MKRGKTKSSKTKQPTKVAKNAFGLPVFTEAVAPSHRIPGEPVGINFKRDRSKYDLDFHPDDFLKLCQEGFFRAEIAAMWGIGLSTLSNWADTCPKMKEAYAKGKAAQQSWYLKRARRAAFEGARDNNGSLIIFLLKNVAGFGDQPGTDFDEVSDTILDMDWELANSKGA